MHYLIQHIEDTLRDSYPAGFGRLFVNDAADRSIGLADFKNQLPARLPVLFYEFYEWAMRVDFPAADVSKKTAPGFANIRFYSLTAVVAATRHWPANPGVGWREGFVEIGRCGDNCALVIDTQGKAATAGNVIYWNFRNGKAYVYYRHFEAMLQTTHELLRRKWYFPPSPAHKPDAYASFVGGEKYRTIENLKQRLNKHTLRIIELT